LIVPTAQPQIAAARSTKPQERMPALQHGDTKFSFALYPSFGPAATLPGFIQRLFKSDNWCEAHKIEPNRNSGRSTAKANLINASAA
jgi:hypothetical protein